MKGHTYPLIGVLAHCLSYPIYIMSFSKEAKEALVNKIDGGSIRILIHVPGRGPRCTGELILQRNSQGVILESFEVSLGILSDDARVGLFYFVNCYVSDISFRMGGHPLSYVQLLDHPDQPTLYDILTKWTPDQINRDIPFHVLEKPRAEKPHAELLTSMRAELTTLEKERDELRELGVIQSSIQQCRVAIATLREQLKDYL